MANISSRYLPGVSYRQWLQDRAYNGSSEEVKRNANRLLNTVGDDGRIDDKYRSQKYYSMGNDGSQSTPYTPGNQQGKWGVYGHDWAGLNAINDQMKAAYNSQNVQYGGVIQDKTKNVSPALSSSRGQSGSSSMTYDPKAVAWLDQQLARFPGLYRNIENNRQNRLKRNAEDYELYRQDTEDQYNQAKRNFEFEKSQRLKTREKRLAGNDASYKNQMDQWQRYLGMMGVGRSSTAQVTVPDALSREATQAKDQIEDENALNATKSQLSWDETERRRSRTLADLINNKNRADDETNAQFDGLVASQKEKEAQLQRERGQAQGRTIGSILNSTQPLVNEADRLNSQASTYGSQRTMVKPDVNVKYDAINPDKFRLDRNQNNINTEVMAGDPNNDMTRNVEEEKKKRYRTLGSLIGA